MRFPRDILPFAFVSVAVSLVLLSAVATCSSALGC